MSYFYRFATYLILVLISLYLVWFGLKNYGENKPTSTFKTPLIKKLSKETSTIEWKKARLQPLKHRYQWASTQFIKNSWALPELSNKPLKEFLQEQQIDFLLLQINFDSPKALPSLRETLRYTELWKKTILCSRTDGLLNDLRRLEPEWTFCSGEILMTRLLSLSSIKLGGLVTIRPDIFFVHLKNIKLSPALKPAINEAKRQNKLVFIGPITRPSEGFDVNGWVLKN